MTPLLEARALRAGYHGCEVLQAVDLEVRPGELWAVLGPNGSGKSTLLKACLGLLPLQGGTVRLLGKPLGEWPRRALAQKVAWVPQSPEGELGFTGLELVLMGRAPHQRGLGIPSAADVAAANQVLGELELSHLAPRFAQEMSGGERRMLMLARALVQAPELLFLDEPTAFLDLRHQVEALARVQARARLGLGVVAVLHDVNLAAAFADHVLLLQAGRALAAGPTRQLLTGDRLEGLYGLPMAELQTPLGQRLFAPRQPQ